MFSESAGLAGKTLIHHLALFCPIQNLHISILGHLLNLFLLLMNSLLNRGPFKGDPYWLGSGGSAIGLEKHESASKWGSMVEYLRKTFKISISPLWDMFVDILSKYLIFQKMTSFSRKRRHFPEEQKKTLREHPGRSSMLLRKKTSFPRKKNPLREHPGPSSMLVYTKSIHFYIKCIKNM